jgi:hypothetical protein
MLTGLIASGWSEVKWPGKRTRKEARNAGEPGYNDIGLYDTSSIASNIVVLINCTLLTVTLYSSVITTLVYNDTKYSVPCMTL